MTDFWLFIIYFEWKSELFDFFWVFGMFLKLLILFIEKSISKRKIRNN